MHNLAFCLGSKPSEDVYLHFELRDRVHITVTTTDFKLLLLCELKPVQHANYIHGGRRSCVNTLCLEPYFTGKNGLKIK